MTLTSENQQKRIKARHGENCDEILDIFGKMFKAYEGPGFGEKKTYNVDIGVDMTTKDVLEKVLDLLNQI